MALLWKYSPILTVAMNYKALLTLFALFVIMHSRTVAQEAVLKRDSIYSAILREGRPLEILYPKNYQPDLPGGYDILYITDGLSDYLRHEWYWLQWEGFIPKNMIIVGIPNTSHNGNDMRNRDFTPTKTDDISGGAKNFLSFFKQELIPYIVKKYPAKPGGSTLSGSSLGGLFVLYAFLNEPKLFTSYIAIDPSLWWDNFYLDKVAATKLDSLNGLKNTLYIAGREGQPYKDMGTFQMDSLLHQKAPPGLVWKCVKLQNETHFSTILKGTWDGLKFSYGGYYASSGGYYSSRNIDYKPMNGIALANRPFDVYCFNLMAEDYIHYTVDGSPPVATSPMAGYKTKITLSADATVILKSIGVRDEYNRTGSMHFKVVKDFPPVSLPKAAIPGSLHYTCYEGLAEDLSAIKKSKPVRSGLADKSFDVNKLAVNGNYACVMDGYLEITKAGYYIFSMGEGNRNSKVFIADQQILGQNMKNGVGENFMVPLAKGFYPYRVEYFHKKGAGNLQAIYMEIENGDQYPVPYERLSAVRK
jgi:predicted alpha/beta superfamily hydrolase